MAAPDYSTFLRGLLDDSIAYVVFSHLIPIAWVLRDGTVVIPKRESDEIDVIHYNRVKNFFAPPAPIQVVDQATLRQGNLNKLRADIRQSLEFYNLPFTEDMIEQLVEVADGFAEEEHDRQTEFTYEEN
jgi:hypothetical protein